MLSVDQAGTQLKVKILKSPEFNKDRERIKLVQGKKPIWKFDESVGKDVFQHWEVPMTEIGTICTHFDLNELVLMPSVKDLFKRFTNIRIPLDQLPKIETFIDWGSRPPKFPSQEEFIRISDERNRLICAFAPGLGKAQPLTSKLRTPNGWIRMGDVKVGDLVIGSNGQPTEVLAVYPQGIRPTYRITFSDKATVECDEEHLWAVYSKVDHSRGKPYRIYSTKQIIEAGVKTSYDQRNFFIPVVTEPVVGIEFDPEIHEIDPYLLGLLLGDGGLSTKHNITYTSVDPQLLESVKSLIPECLGLIKSGECTYRISRTSGDDKENPLNTKMRKLGLLPIACADRFIPDSYKFGCPNIRRSVLAGLLDTDGYVSKKGETIEFSSKSYKLITDVQDIVESFGGNSYLAAKVIGGCTYYRLNIVLDFNPFRLLRKVNRWKSQTKYTKYKAYRAIESIIPIGNQECQCIRVSAADSLYLTDNYIVTHNTFASLHRARLLGFTQLLIICPKSIMVNWRTEVHKTYNNTEAVLIYHGTVAQRAKLKDRLKTAPVIITTYSMLDEVNDLKVDQIILDEAHALSHSNTKVWKSARKLIKGNPTSGIQLLTGTPILHKPKDLWGLVWLLYPELAGEYHAWKSQYEEVVKSFKKRIPRKDRTGRIMRDPDTGEVLTREIEIPLVTRTKNLDHLRERVRPFLYRVKADGLVNFVDTVDVVTVGMTKRQRALYDSIAENVLLKLEEGDLNIVNALSELTRCMQVSEGCYTLPQAGFADSGKLDYVKEQIDSSDEKIITWSRFKENTHILGEYYKDTGVTFNGDMSQNQKTLAIWSFQGVDNAKDEAEFASLARSCKWKFGPGEAQQFFAVISGASLGFNLHASRRQIVLTPGWNGNINEQAFARIKRLDQEADECFTTFVVSEDSIDESALNMVLDNLKTCLLVLDGTGDPGYGQVRDLIKKLRHDVNKRKGK